MSSTCGDSFSTHVSLLILNSVWASLVAETVQNLPALQETWVQSLGWEDPWRRTWQPTLVFLPTASPWTEESGGLQSRGSQRVRQIEIECKALCFT